MPTSTIERFAITGFGAGAGMETLVIMIDALAVDGEPCKFCCMAHCIARGMLSELELIDLAIALAPPVPLKDILWAMARKRR